jgi:hypothetical protein
VVLAAVLNEALQSIGSWMRANKLSVNIEKIDYVIFHSRHKKVSYDISLSFDDKCITRKPKVSFWGVFWMRIPPGSLTLVMSIKRFLSPLA